MSFFGKKIMPLYVIFFLYLITIGVFFLERSQGRERDESLRRFNEFSDLIKQYRAIKGSRTLDIGNKASQGLLQLIDGLCQPIGIKDRVGSVKIAGSREFKEIIEERGEVDIDKLTMNELINLLYRIENYPAPLSIKEIRMKKDFEKPERLDVAIKISLFSLKKGAVSGNGR